MLALKMSDIRVEDTDTNYAYIQRHKLMRITVACVWHDLFDTIEIKMFKTNFI
jgi:hypothetical protein